MPMQRIKLRRGKLCNNPCLPYANSKGADQPANPHSLINAFVVHCLDSIIPLVSISKISSLYLAPVSALASLNLPGRKFPKTGGSTDLFCTDITIEEVRRPTVH